MTKQESCNLTWIVPADCTIRNAITINWTNQMLWGSDWRTYSSLSNNPAGWNKPAGWTFFKVNCRFIWLVIVKKYQIRTCRLEFFLKNNKICSRIIPAKPTPPAEGRWQEASVASGVWAERFYSWQPIFKCPCIRITHTKKNVPVHKYVRVKIVAPDLRARSTQSHGRSLRRQRERSERAQT